MILLVGTACGETSSDKATDDSAATIDEISTTVAEPTITTTTKPTEQPTTVAKKEKPTEPATKEEPVEAEGSEQDVQKQPEKEDTHDEKKDTADTEQAHNVSDSNYSQSDVDLVARTVYLESGSCGEYCQWLTASTILNLAESRGGIADVVYDYNTFNVAGMVDSCSPSDLSYSVAERVLSGDRDYNVMAFRAGYYHSFGTPYTNADNVYFSTY